MPRAKKIKVDVSGITVEDIDRLADEVAAIDLKVEEYENTRDGKIQDIRETWAARLKPLLGARAEKVALAKTWADENKDQFQKPRTRSTALASYGWRWGQWRVTAARGVKIATALARLLTYKDLRQYTRIKREIDKEALIRDREKLDTATRKRAGIRIEQKEDFFIEAKRDDALAEDAA